MYLIRDEQIEYILNDIRRNGVELEDLQYNLLDHVCCIIEQELEENGDFEQFYRSTIKKFYKSKLVEIEDETRSLLTNKNYYTMKKVMIVSGTIASVLLTAGIVSKFLHLAGAGITIVLGIFALSFIFLPLLFTLKIKEKKDAKDKVLLGLGSISAITISLAVMFKLMFWPGANMLALVSVGVLLLIFLPIYFVSGIRNPDTKVNTIVSSIIIIMGCGLFFALVRSPRGSHVQFVSATANYVRNEMLLNSQKQFFVNGTKSDSMGLLLANESKQINELCDALKSFILESETGFKSLDENFEAKDALISDGMVRGYFDNSDAATAKLDQLKALVKEYNAKVASTKRGNVLPFSSTILDVYNDKTISALNTLVQIQQFVFLNENRS